MDLFFFITIVQTFLFTFILLFGCILLTFPKQFYNLTNDWPLLKIYHNVWFKSYEPREINDNYIKNQRLIGLAIVLIAGMTVFDGSRKIYLSIFPSNKNVQEIVSESDTISLEFNEYHNIKFFNDHYYSDVNTTLKVEERSELITKLEGVRIRTFMLSDDRVPTYYYRGGLDFKYEYDQSKYIKLSLYENDDLVGEIIFFDEEDAYFKTPDDKYAKLKGDYKKAYQYLLSIKQERQNND